jgi:hypothetical protein
MNGLRSITYQPQETRCIVQIIIEAKIKYMACRQHHCMLWPFSLSASASSMNMDGDGDGEHAWRWAMAREETNWRQH